MSLHQKRRKGKRGCKRGTLTELWRNGPNMLMDLVKNKRKLKYKPQKNHMLKSRLPSIYSKLRSKKMINISIKYSPSSSYRNLFAS